MMKKEENHQKSLKIREKYNFVHILGIFLSTLDPDPDPHSNPDPDPGRSLNTDPDPQHCFFPEVTQSINLMLA